MQENSVNFTPTVSVLMSVYNGEKYLREAIESILAQTFTDFEFLIINDGSTDASRDIILSYRDERIRLVENENNIGLTRSLNKGISLACGKYIARMDADDISMPERLEKQVGFMEAHEDVAVCGSWTRVINSTSQELDIIEMPVNNDAIIGTMFFYNCIIHGSVIFDKDKIVALGSYNDSFIRTQDYELWFKCIKNKLHLSNIPEVLYKLRKCPENISSVYRDDQEIFARRVLQKFFTDILCLNVSYKSIIYYRKSLLGQKLSFVQKIILRLLILKFKRRIKHAFKAKADVIKIIDNKIEINFLDNTRKLNFQSVDSACKKLISMKSIFKNILKSILLKIPQVKRYHSLLEKANNEHALLLSERGLLLSELAFNYANGSLAIRKYNTVGKILPEMHKLRDGIKNKKKRILFVAMTNSIHAAKWISQLNDMDEFDLHLFPSVDVSGQIHPLFKSITVHLPVNREHVSENYYEDYYAYELARLIKKIEPDIIHSLEMQHAGYLTYSAKQIFKENFPKWIYSCWGSDLYYFQQFDYHKKRINETLSSCNYLITDTQRDVELAILNGFKGKYLGTFPGPGGINIEKARSLVELSKPSSRRIIVVKGYSGWVYRPGVLLDAIELCKDVLSEYKIVVYLPGGDIAEKIEKLIANTNLHVESFNYTTDHEQVLKLFASARISLASSISDGTPNSMLESMLMGAFPIQSDTISTQEWINHGTNGMLAPPESSEKFAECLRLALINDTLVDAAFTYNYILLKEKTDESIVKPLVLEAYKSVLKE